MKTIQIRVPDEIDLKDYDYAMIIASKLYEEGKLSTGQAAMLQHYPKELLLNYLAGTAYLFSVLLLPIYTAT